MPPIIIPPLVKWTFVALGGAALMHWVIKESRRINAELHPERPEVSADPREGEALATLRRDPSTGDWRVR